MADSLWELYPDKYAKCGTCDGTGKAVCYECNGKGHTFGPIRSTFGGVGALVIHKGMGFKQCRICSGSGKRICPMCEGRGYRERPKV